MLRALSARRFLAVIALVVPALPASGIVVGGGGTARTDCLAVFDAPVNFPADEPRQVVCTDGDPNCDGDAAEGPNGVCVIALSVCVNSTFSSACNLTGVASILVEHSFDTGLDPKFDPDFQAVRQRIESELLMPNATNTTPNACTTPINVRVRIKGPLGNNHCHKNRKKLQLTAQSVLIDGDVFSDKDKIKLTCLPNPNDGCNPKVLFDGTFDRIQKQIFSQSCAVGGCHDSQSQTGNMILEAGAAYTNLINVTPDKAAAAAAGWKRVTVLIQDMSGDPDTSFIMHKLTGDLPDSSYGARMPFGRPKLNQTLIDIIETWIRNGAPQTGWLDGTF